MGFLQVDRSDRSRFVVHPAWRLMKVIYNFCIFFGSSSLEAYESYLQKLFTIFVFLFIYLGRRLYIYNHSEFEFQIF